MMPIVTELKIDPEFQRLIPPLSSIEYETLEQNMLRDGCKDPIRIWQDIILDDHNRYEICYKHGISYASVSVNLPNRDAAIAWLCANQVGRPNITEETRKYLIGKRYEAEKKLELPNSLGPNYHSEQGAHRSRVQSPFWESQNKIAAAIGREYNVGPTTIQQYGRYASAIDSIASKREDLVVQILLGKVKISGNSTLRLSNIPAPAFDRACEELIRSQDESPPFANSRKIIDCYIGAPAKKLRPCIKDMPAYDPDAEIRSLALTVPSWRNSIERICSAANICATSSAARHNLINELQCLNKATGTLLTVLKEQQR